MKKIIIGLLILVVAISICVFAFSERAKPDSQGETKVNSSQLGVSTVQYCIYAPEGSEVLVDNEAIPYSDSLNCYEAIIKKGKHNLVVRHEGCEDKTAQINSSDVPAQMKINMTYTSNHISEGETAAKELLTDIINKCWSLDYDLNNFSFLNEQDKRKTESVVDSIIMSFEERLSAEYSVGDISFELLPLSAQSDRTNLSCDSDGGIVYPFTLTYSYTYYYNSDSYSTSQEVTKTCTPHIVIEKSNGVWNIKSLYLSLSNGEY